eukprot:Nk52_evm9s77 gene=Nk52_evmTU9s77
MSVLQLKGVLLMNSKGERCNEPLPFQDQTSAPGTQRGCCYHEEAGKVGDGSVRRERSEAEQGGDLPLPGDGSGYRGYLKEWEKRRKPESHTWRHFSKHYEGGEGSLAVGTGKKSKSKENKNPFASSTRLEAIFKEIMMVMSHTRVVSVEMEACGICRIVLDNGALFSLLLDPLYGQPQKIIIDRSLVSKSKHANNKIHAACFKEGYRLFTFTESRKIVVTRVSQPEHQSRILSGKKKGGSNTDTGNQQISVQSVMYAELADQLAPLSSLHSKVDYLSVKDRPKVQCEGTGAGSVGEEFDGSYDPYCIDINKTCRLCVLWSTGKDIPSSRGLPFYNLVLCKLPQMGVGKSLSQEKPSVVYKIKRDPVVVGSPRKGQVVEEWRMAMCEFSVHLPNILYVLEVPVTGTYKGNNQRPVAVFLVYDCDPNTGLNRQSRTEILVPFWDRLSKEECNTVCTASLSNGQDVIALATRSNHLFLWRVREQSVFDNCELIKLPFHNGICTKIEWHSEDMIFYTASSNGRISFYDRCLNVMEMQEGVADNRRGGQGLSSGHNYIDFSKWIRPGNERGELCIKWFKPGCRGCGNDNEENHHRNFGSFPYRFNGAYLMVSSSDVFFLILRVDAGCFSEFSLSLKSLVCEWLRKDALNEALQLVESVRFSHQNIASFSRQEWHYALNEIAEHLLQLPQSFIDQDYVDAFKRLYVCLTGVNDTSALADTVTLVRRFVFRFISGGLFEAAFEMACAIKAADLLMIIYQRAKGVNDFDLAGIALTKCNLLINRGQEQIISQTPPSHREKNPRSASRDVSSLSGMSISCIDLDAVYVPENGARTEEATTASYGASLHNVNEILSAPGNKKDHFSDSGETPLELGMRLEIEGHFNEAYALYKEHHMVVEARRLKMMLFAESQRLQDPTLTSIDAFET